MFIVHDHNLILTGLQPGDGASKNYRNRFNGINILDSSDCFLPSPLGRRVGDEGLARPPSS